MCDNNFRDKFINHVHDKIAYFSYVISLAALNIYITIPTSFNILQN